MMRYGVSHRYFSSKLYNFAQIEHKWQEKWNKTQPSKLNLKSNKPKLYCLSQFPYPSGSIHLGHVRVYAITDILARFYKLAGYNVINPMGWDSFGLPAENAAIERGIPPREWTKKNIEEMRTQLKRMGFDFDWDKELSTCSPEYYKFTQQIFIKLYMKGLAYKKSAYVNWDPVDCTVLANEQINQNGCSWRSGAKAQKKLLNQWFFNIRKYAPDMLKALDDEILSTWPSAVKETQRGWIGKSKGAKVLFKLKVSNDKQVTTDIPIFTTRPETIYGVTFIAISPESPIVTNLLKQSEMSEEILQKYIQKSDTHTKVSAQTSSKDIDPGFLIKNIKAIHPLTLQELPIYVADYVLNDYGTGSVMGVPFHDERDFYFAQKNEIPMVQVIAASAKDMNTVTAPYIVQKGVIINSDCGINNKDLLTASKIIVKKLVTKQAGYYTNEYRLKDWLVSRQRYWGVPIPIINCQKCGTLPVLDSELPVLLPELKNDSDFSKKGNILDKIQEFKHVKCHKCGEDATRETDTLDTFVDSSWYYLRYLDVHNNKRYCSNDKINEWMPVDIYVGGMEHAIMHLLYARFIHRFLRDEENIRNDDKMKEPFKELLTQGLVKGLTLKRKSDGKYLQASDANKLNADEYEKTYEKMSKSKGNGLNPMDLLKEYGADVIRLGIIFAAPSESDLKFDDTIMSPPIAWINKLFKMYNTIEDSFKETPLTIVKFHEEKMNKENQILLRQSLSLIREISLKIQESRSLHVGIARMMEMTNLLNEADFNKSKHTFYYVYNQLILSLYPYAPHFSSEIWERLRKLEDNSKESLEWRKIFSEEINEQPWPNVEIELENLISTVKIPVTINGKLVGTIEVDKTLQGNADELFKVVMSEEFEIKNVNKLIDKDNIEKIVAFKDKPVLNFVLKK